MLQTHLTHPKYRADVDGLRAIAILSVVGFHAFPNLFMGGFVGVDIFFVISGYLISTIIFGNLERGSFSYVEFYSRRIKRIFPALILVLISSFVFGWHVLLAAEYKQLGKHIASGAGFISNLVLWFESGYFDNASKTKPLLHLWSLGIEEQFYIIWPLLLGFMWQRKWNFLSITLLIAAASFAVNILTVGDHPVGAFYSPLSRFWELMAGGVLAYLTLHRPRHLPSWRSQSAIGLVLIAAGILFLTDKSLFPGWWALLPTTGAFLIIAAGPGAWINKNLLGNRLLVWIGLISYPLYLWHWPLLSFARIVEAQTPSYEVRIAAVLASVILAWLTYRFIETPIRDRKRESNKALIIWLAVGMALVGVVGYYTFQRDGLAFRKYHRLAGIGKDYDFRLGYRQGQCFLDTHEDPSSSFADVCSGITKSEVQKPLILLWGDSHAASLYRGLNNQKSKFNFDLAQYNTSGCPPIMDLVSFRDACPSNNQYVVEKIKELHPSEVVMSAWWSLYGYLSYDDKLKSTIQLLKSLGVQHIVVVGQLPVFVIAQPNVGVKYFVANKVDRTYQGFDRNSSKVNEKIRAIAKANGIEFISPIDLVCNLEGCLISTSKTKLIPLAFDESHLTENGSNLLIELAIRNGQLHFPVQ